MFSARFLRSNIDFLTGSMFMDASPEIKKRSVMNLIKAIGGIASVLLIVDAFDDDAVDFNPTSSDFGKIVIGNTSYDITGGMGSLIILVARLITGYSKSSATGKIRKMDTGKFGEYGTKDTVFSFFENKLSPVANFWLNIREGERFGEKETLPKKLGKLVTPIGAQNIMETKDEEIANRIQAAISDFFGFSTSTYDREKGIRE